MPFDQNRPLVGFHTRLEDKATVPALKTLIEEGLAPLGFNTLILEFNPGYAYRCFPQYSNGSFGRQEALAVREICDKHAIRVIPLFQCLSHQSNFSAVPWPLFEDHPEFLETPDVPADATWPDFYCHSWCASNDGIYDYVFPMIDELIEDFEPQVLHIGIDEVFEIGEESCPRCRGKDKATLLARTVKILHDHLQKRGVETMMWGDRLLDADKLGYQMWEADKFGMHPAFDRAEEITRDLLICDWHYDHHDHGYPSIDQFLRAGFYTLPAIAADPVQGKHFWAYCLDALYTGRKLGWPGKLGGLVFTHWTPLTPQGVEQLMAGLSGGPVDRSDAFGSGATGETIAQIAPHARNLKKAY